MEGEIKEAINEKQCLLSRYEDNRLLYNRARNNARTVVRQAQQTSWENFIFTVEEELYGREELASKFIKTMNEDTRDMLK